MPARHDHRARRTLHTLTVVALFVATAVALTHDLPVAEAAPVGTIDLFGQEVSFPAGIVQGPDGNQWFTNSGASSIGRITPSGQVGTFTGPGVSGPAGITVGADGALWFTNQNNDSIGRITTAGAVTNFTGVGIKEPKGITAGPDGALWFTNRGNNTIGRITVAGVVSSFAGATVNDPVQIAAGSDGALWFTNNLGSSIGRVSTAGVITAISDPAISYPWGITAHSDGNLWVTNLGTGQVARITTGGVVTPFAKPGGAEDPYGIASGADGNLWYVAQSTNVVVRLTPAGVSTVFHNVGIDEPYAIAPGADGNLWFTNIDNASIGRVTTAGTISTFSFAPTRGPIDIAAGPDGNLWFTNQRENSVGRITPQGVIRNFTAAGIDLPQGITGGPDGNVWFTNAQGNTIGRITPAGVVALFSGPGIAGPQRIALGPDGNLWFTNFSNHSIGRITPGGVVTNFAAPGSANPFDITAGPDGSLWFSDNGGTKIGRITTSGGVTMFDNGTSSPSGGITKGPDGNLWFTLEQVGIGRLTPTGTPTTYPSFTRPSAITAGADGNLWFTTTYPGGVGRLTPAGVYSTFANSAVDTPAGITAGPDHNVWFTSYGTNVIGRVAVGVAAAPTAVAAVAGRTSATVSWTAPASSGNPPVTGYTVTAAPGGRSCTTVAPTLTCEVVGLDGGTSYTFSVRAANAIGASGPSAPSNAVVPWSGSVYHAIAPARLLDSRTPVGGWASPLVAGPPRSLAVTGGAIPANATAVVAKITATEGSAGSFLTVGPTGTATPNASNVNFAAGQTIANLATVKVGPGGSIDFANNAGHVDVVVDALGYYDDLDGTGARFTGIAPARVLDSRTPVGGWDSPLVAGTPRTLTLTGAGSADVVPPDAVSVVVNLTATGATAGSFVAVSPTAGTPTTSDLNFRPGQTIAGLAIVKPGADGRVHLTNAQGAVDVIVDVVGYFAPASGTRFHPMAPTRVLDDRVGLGASGPWGPGQTRSVGVRGVGGIAPTATGAVLNVTATDASTGSFVSIFPSGSPLPASSNLNFGTSETIANLDLTALGGDGAVQLRNANGTVHLIADASGFFATW